MTTLRDDTADLLRSVEVLADMGYAKPGNIGIWR
jgi:hypothetical protein